MAAYEIGSIVFKLTGDATGAVKAVNETVKSLREADSKMLATADIAKKASLAFAAAFSAIGVAVANELRKSINEMDEMGKAAESLGVPVEKLSALKYAADLSGVAFEQLSQGLTKLTQGLANASAKGSDPASRALSALGMSARESTGQLKSADAVMIQVADRFSRMRDGAGKTAIAVGLFGEAGAKLIPFLNEGSAGISKLTDEAARLGVVISGDAAAAAAEFNDTLSKLGAGFNGVFNEAAVKLLPTLQLLADAFVEDAHQSGVLSAAIDIMVDAFKVLISAGTLVKTAFEVIGTTVSTVAQAISLAASGEFMAAYETLKAGSKSMVASVGEDMQFINNLWDGWAARTTEASVAIPAAAAPIMQTTRDLADAQRLADEAQRSWNETMERGAHFMQALETPEETQKRKMQELIELYAKGALTAEQFQLAQERMAVGSMQNWEQLAGVVAGSLTTIFGNNKAAAIAEALINTYLAVTKTMASLPWPFNIAAAAAQTAAGLAQVAQIRSTNISAREFGGPVSAGQPYIVGEKRPKVFVPNTSGTIVPSAFGRDMGDGAVIHIEGIDPKKFYTGDQMRYLAEGLIRYQRNGGRILNL
ncbi:MAG: hypothetical protein WDN31_05620 [Hyphomicrobium sp.]